AGRGDGAGDVDALAVVPEIYQRECECHVIASKVFFESVFPAGNKRWAAWVKLRKPCESSGLRPISCWVQCNPRACGVIASDLKAVPNRAAVRYIGAWRRCV
ncbi:MAG: hypothetical protein WAM15_02745, partial [Candidatus Acidiferrales bacterium]